MTSKSQIGKLALQHIGDRFDISDLDEASVEAEQVDLVFDNIRDAVLRQHPWSFAKKFASPASLTATTAVPVPGNWDYMFQYPTDCLKMLHIVNPLGDDKEPIRYDVARNANNTRVILCNEADPEIVYTMRVTNTGQYDPEFVMALSYAIGAAIAMPLTGEVSIAKELKALSVSTGYHAEESDSNEGVDPHLQDAPHIRARL
jgi:hypothetical protein